jgi:signal transduction histidine kinase
MGETSLRLVDSHGLPEKHLEAYVRMLEALISASDIRGAADVVLKTVSAIAGCEAVAVRISDGKGDFPYIASVGFDGQFLAKEASLCKNDVQNSIVRDETGHPFYECVCGLVVQGKTNPRLKYFTSGGSFWTNSISELMAGGDVDKLGTSPRGTCISAGYETIVLVPMRTNRGIIGLIQADSRRRHSLKSEDIVFLEKIGASAGPVIESFWREEQLGKLAAEFDDERRQSEMLIALSELTSMLTHELKSPLAGMMLAATRLRKALAELPGEKKLEAIAAQLSDSINVLSSTIRLASDKVKTPALKFSPVDVTEPIENAVLLVARRAEAAGVNIVRDAGHDLPRISADPNFLTRAFLNLLTNALDVMPEGGVLTLTTRCVEDVVEVVVSDTGTGIDPKILPTMFKPFASTKPGGLGLGLPIVRRVIDLHSGTVVLEPRPQGGTSVVVRIPVLKETDEDCRKNQAGHP